MRRYFGINKKSWSPQYRDPKNLLDIDIIAFTAQPQENHSKTTHDGLPAVAIYKLSNAFIKTITQTPLDWGAVNNISSVMVEICYEWFETEIPGAVSPFANEITAKSPPLNFDTVLAKYPILAPIYDATKRTVLGDSRIMSNPILNQVGQFAP